MGQAGVDWNYLRAFLATASEGSYSAAARTLGLTQPSVGRQVAALEAALGVVLLERNPRGMTLTQGGLELVEYAKRMQAAAEELELAATGQSTALDGAVRITASEAVAIFHLPAIVRQIRADYPGIQVEIIATSESSDLPNREADIAIRNHRPSDPRLIAKRVADTLARLYATPAYLEGLRAGGLGLEEATYLGFDREERFLRDLQAFGLSLTQANFPVVSPSHLVQWELARQGQGICLMLESAGDADPAVMRAADDGAVFQSPTYLVCHRELRTTRRLRVVFDLLAAELGTER